MRELPEPQRSLTASLWDVAAYGAMVGVGESYIGWYAVHREAPAWFLGLLPTVSMFLGALVQIPCANLMERSPRRRTMYMAGSVGQALLWLPILATLALPRDAALVLLVVSFAAYLGAVNFSAPAWYSTMGDLVPPDERGRYFARRTRVFYVSLLLAQLSGGAVLEVCEDRGLALWGFAAIFAVAFLARILSVAYLGRMKEPPYVPRPDAGFTLWEFVRATPRANYARFVLYASLFSVGVHLSGPFFDPYIKHDLRFSHTAYSLILAAATAGQIAQLYTWGPLCDRFGTKRILSFCGMGIAFVPLAWTFFRSPWSIGALQFVQGGLWSGFNLALGNYTLDAVTPERRARCYAYFSVLNGAGVLVGGLLGSALVLFRLPGEILGYVLFSPFHVLMVLSTVVRLIVHVVFVRVFREVREVPAISAMGLFLQASHLRAILHLPVGLRMSPRWGSGKGPA